MFDSNDESGRVAEEFPYQHYKELGGRINEIDYANALARAGSAYEALPDTSLRVIAEYAGIVLTPSMIRLYHILRNDKKPEEVKYHHAQMGDQPLFAEVLRMLGDTDSLNKLIAKYPNTSFH